MADVDILIEQRAGVSILRMNRPPANAFTLDFARNLESAFASVLKSGPEALVITGSGDFFSGGLDLRIIPQYSAEEQRSFLEVLNRVMGALYACPLPLVAGVNGHAIAGAFVLTLTADYRVGPMNDTSQFGLTEARVGIPFPAVPAVVVQAEMAPNDVRFTTLCAKNFPAEQALSRGFFDELQPQENVLERAVEVARDLASMPADGYARIKQQFRAAAIEKIEQINAEQSDPMLDTWVSGEAAEASDAVLSS